MAYANIQGNVSVSSISLVKLVTGGLIYVIMKVISAHQSTDILLIETVMAWNASQKNFSSCITHNFKM